MNIGKQYSKDKEDNYGNINRNEFTLIDRNKTGNDVILEFIKQKNVAPWFRGTSHFHILGADKLFNSLRDDGEQKTTHRVRTCLHLMGLKPMITSKQINFLMRISRGNDLVFLWFLMEMHYKTPKDNPKSYSINEQLICSAICHLDMITTLRELDKILPRSHASTIEMQHAREHRQHQKEAALKLKNKKQKEYVLPYFSKYPRFQQYGKRLYIKEPDFKVQFNFYKRYSNPNHTVQNESNRWYANYHFNSSKRVVNLIIKEVIKTIFSNPPEDTLRLRNTEVLCDYHKTVKIMAENLEHELRVKAKNDCLKCHFGVKVNNDKQIKDQLDKAIQQESCKLRKQAKITRKNESLKTITSTDKIVNIILEDNGTCDCNSNYNQIANTNVNASTNVNVNTNTTANTNTNTNTTDDTAKLKEEVAPKITCNKKHKHCDFDGYHPDCSKVFEPQKDQIEGKIKAKYIYNDNCSVNDTASPLDSVFNRPNVHKPFQFDYRKIFASKDKDDERTSIRQMFLAALDETSLNFPAETEQSHHTYDEAVRKCAKKTFDDEVKKYHVENDSQNAESFRPLGEFPSIMVHNGENFILMEKMLFEAFQYLRKDTKFVWAQLPDAHRIPSLREWIARRFGKVYPPAERSKSYRMSCIVFGALDKSEFKFSLPTAKNIGKNYFLNYNCRNHIDRKVQHIKDKFYHHLDSHFLDHTRIFWFAMRGYICSNGPPRKTFYSYMPSRQQDIQHFRLWKTTEYRNNWNAWNSRRFKRNQQH